MDEQITIDGYLSEKLDAIKERYPIPDIGKYKSLEGWTDDWHYCEMDSPKQPGVYYGIAIFGENETYIYSYYAWAKGKWWSWDSWRNKWKKLPCFETMLAWTQIPSMYRKNDVSLPDRLGLRGII